MALPAFTMRQLLEAGVHFGHSTRRWNPKMAPYLFGVRNGIHIIDLRQTVPMLHRAMVAVRDVVAGGGRVLFVGTKRQASDKVAEAAKRCGQYYLNHRWLGGTMTNWQTISKSIKHLRDLDEQLASEESQGLTKKELLRLTRKRDKLERALGGIKEMGGLPDILIVIDTNKEAIAIAEANKIGIPVVGITDSNSDPKGIDYIIPGNDDAIRAINVYCDLMAATVIDGIQAEMTATGVDLGEAQEAPAEALPAKSEAAKPAAKVAVADKAPAKAVPVKSEAAKPDAAAAPVAPVTQTDKTADAVETPAEAAVADKAPAKSEAAKPDAVAAPVASVDKTEAATGEAKKDSPAEESPPPQDAPRASAGE